MSLNWGFCLPGSGAYVGRIVRFAIDYGSFPKPPIIPEKVKSYKGFWINTEKRRISILVNPDTVKRCDLTTKVITTDPLAEIFYNDFINANIPLFGSYQKVQSYTRFYCFDENGTDIPFVPNMQDLTTSTGFAEMQKFILPTLLLVGGYFYLTRKKRK